MQNGWDEMAIKSNTKKLLAEAFEQLLTSRSFDSITVQDIIKQCGISRTAFYRHFKDKHDLMNWVYKNRIEEIIKNNPDITSWKNLVFEVMQFAKNKRHYFEHTITYTDQNSLLDFIFHCGFDYSKKLLSDTLGTKELPEDILFSIRLYCAGTGYMLRDWIINGMKDPPETVAQRMCDNIPSPIGRYLC